jgi:hypothetical protein
MNLPERDDVVAVLMGIYEWTFHIVVILAVATILYVIWHLIPKKEY